MADIPDVPGQALVKKRNPKGSPQNLRKGTSDGQPRSKRAALPPRWNTFCIEYCLTNSQDLAASKAGFHPKYSQSLMKQPVIIERIKHIEATLLAKELEKRFEHHIITEGFLDKNLKRLIEQNDNIPAAVRGVEVGYKKEGLIRDTSIVNNNTAQAASGLTPQSEDKHLYLAKRFRSPGVSMGEEAGVPKQLEAGE